MRHVLAAAVLALSVTACGGSDSPSAPTPTYTVNGSVTVSGTSTGIAGATVSITDGVNAGKSATTQGSDGSYTISGVQAGTFTLSVSATNYTTQTKSVSLTANQTVSFQMALATAAVTFSIDQATCGTRSNDPIVDTYIDGHLMQTLYNVSKTSVTYQVTYGTHTFAVTGGGRTNAWGPLTQTVTAAGLVFPVTCRP